MPNISDIKLIRTEFLFGAETFISIHSVLAIDVSGPLDSIRTTQLTEQVLIARSHVKCGKDLLVAREPCTKSTNSETENIAGFALSLEEGFEVVIFDFFTGSNRRR